MVFTIQDHVTKSREKPWRPAPTTLALALRALKLLD
jgi:hypothetical protein